MRDSKLTRFLQPALGGNARTAIICTATLADLHANETLNTLDFAFRAMNIKNRVKVNEVCDSGRTDVQQDAERVACCAAFWFQFFNVVSCRLKKGTRFWLDFIKKSFNTFARD